jgi:hypothetical protein
MSRSTAMRTLAWTLRTKAGVEVEATYDSYGSNRGWYLTWADGPSEATMRKRVAAAARGKANIDVKSLRYVRNKTELLRVVAFLAYVLPRPEVLADPPWEALYAYDDTDFPGELDYPETIVPKALDPEAWELGRYALDRFTEEGRFPDGQEVVRQIARLGLNALRLDHWRSQAGRQSDCRLPPPALTVDTAGEKVQHDLQALISRVQAELTGDSTHRDDPHVQLLAAETARKLLLATIDRQQRRIAAHALADGAALGPLSTSLGLSTRTLGMRFGKDLDDEVAPLVWLRDHAEDWARACTAAASAVNAAPNFFYSAERRELRILEMADPGRGWRGLVGTVPAARALLEATRRRPPQGASDALRRLEELLDAHDHAPPPARRERALRRAIQPDSPE